MNKNIERVAVVTLMAALFGCAGAKVADQVSNAPAPSSTRPNQIIVYPFAANPDQVTLNQSILQRAYRNVSGEQQSASQQKMASEAASNLCQHIVSDLTAKGYNAVCLERGTPITADNALIVDGEFVDINEGNRLRRLVVGFGAGASTLDTSVHVYQRTGSSNQQLIDFNTHADSGKMPGAAVMGPVGFAASGSAAAAAGGAAAVGGAKTFTSSTDYLTDKTATQVSDTIAQYYTQHGWAS